MATAGVIVLCGGMSRRMGRPKAWLPFGNERLLQRVVRLAGQGERPVVAVAAPGQELPELPADVTIARDPVSGRGPLQGLAVGMRALPEPVALAYATATDVPFLEPRWIECLIDRIGTDDLAIPYIQGYYHPLAALYRRSSVLPVIDRLLQENRLRPVFLMEYVKTCVLGEEDLAAVDPRLRALRNLNDSTDYEQALRDAGLDA
jgi:molybdopterin-guanine dinucleotide biosynthesis protein A